MLSAVQYQPSNHLYMETVMIEVSDEAMKHLGEVGGTENRGIPIRFAVMGSGATNCGLGLMIDRIKETDLAFQKGEYTLIIDKSLAEYCKQITLDFTKGVPDRCDSRSHRGFLITAENPVLF